jgi:hypothetical protein
METEWRAAERELIRFFSAVLRNYYGYPVVTRDTALGTLYNYNRGYGGSGQRQDTVFSALFNAMGTQRSSREGLIRRPYEFLYELFAQYIKDGEITLNIPPKYIPYGRKAWGRSTNGLWLKQEFRGEGAQQGLSQAVERFEDNMAWLFDDILESIQGKILMM